MSKKFISVFREMVLGGSPECNKTWNSNKNAYTGPPDCQKIWWEQVYEIGNICPFFLIGIIAKIWWGTVLKSSHVPAALYDISRHKLRHTCAQKIEYISEDKIKRICFYELFNQSYIFTRCGRVMADNIAYAKFRKNLIIW